jgi:hypothetical protein
VKQRRTIIYLLLQELKLLEENIEQSLLREEAALGTHNTLASGDEQMARLEVCRRA